MFLKKRHNKNSISIVVFFGIILTLTTIFFVHIEPGDDQIRHISWIQNVTESKYFINFELVDKYGLFYEDENSFLISLFRPVYSDLGHLFNVFPIILIYLFSLIFNDLIIIFNFTSILFFCFNTILAFKLFEKFFIKDFKNIYTKFFILIFCISSYYFFYSPHGFHNIALFFNLVVILHLKENTLVNFSNKNFFLLLIFSTLGIYSHKTNLILIISLISLFFLYNKNFKNLFKYLFFQIFLLSPAILIVILFPETIFLTKDHAGLDFSISTYLTNLILWFKNILITLGPIPLLFFLSGLFQSIKYKKNLSILLFVIIIHISFYILVTSVPVHFIRTNLYINYVILLFFIFSVIKFYESKNIFLKIFVIICLLFHCYFNLYSIIQYKNQDFKTHLFKDYYKNNGNIKMAFSIFKKQLKDSDKLIYLDNMVEDYFKIYENDIYIKQSIKIRPILNLVSDHKLKKKDNVKLLIHDQDRIILLSLTNNKKLLDKAILKVNELFSQNNLNCTADIKLLDLIEDVRSNGAKMRIHKLYCNLN